MTLRKTYKNWDKAKETATELAAILQDKFNEEKLYSNFVDSINKIWEYKEEDVGLEFE
jgi:disulfide oxidoreductase YuzD